MKRKNYSTPETDICLLNISASFLQEGLDLDSVEKTSGGGIINANSSFFLDDEEDSTPKNNNIWDSL